MFERLLTSDSGCVNGCTVHGGWNQYLLSGGMKLRKNWAWLGELLNIGYTDFRDVECGRIILISLINQSSELFGLTPF